MAVLAQKALREIRAYQKSVDNLIPKAPFQRLVREIMQSVGPPVCGAYVCVCLQADGANSVSNFVV